MLRFDRASLLGARGLSVLGAGLWSLFVTSFLLIVYLKLTPSQSGLGFHSVKHMFYTSLLGFFFLIFYIVTAVGPGRRAPSGRVLLGGLGVLCLVLVWAGVHRTLAKTPRRRTGTSAYRAGAFQRLVSAGPEAPPWPSCGMTKSVSMHYAIFHCNKAATQ